MGKKLQIHSSTVEFLIFQLESKEEGIDIFKKDEKPWFAQDVFSCHI